MHIPKEVQDAIQKVNSGISTPEDRAVITDWYNSFDDSSAVVDAATNEEEIKSRILQAINRRKPAKPLRRVLYFRIAAAASALLIMGYLAFRLYPDQPADLNIQAGVHLNYTDGEQQQINSTMEAFLDSTAFDNLSAYQKNRSEQLLTLSTAKGQLYKFVLNDGTKIWLNAGSKLTIMPAFNEQTRTVKLIGEAYFEVAKNEKVPFEVISDNQTIRVLGTKFNVKAYHDEASITHLYEGKIALNTPVQSEIVLPGQAVINELGRLEAKQEDQSVSKEWTSSIFSFSNQNMTDILNNLSRFYNVQLDYQSPVPDKLFTGKIQRNSSLSDVLDMLSAVSGGIFKIKDRTVSIEFKNSK